MSYCYPFGTLSDRIGSPAMLEQTAEECSELAKACLKLARYIRGENETYKTFDEIMSNLNEEAVDVRICIKELEAACLIAHKEELYKLELYKRKRMKDRLDGKIKPPEEPECKSCMIVDDPDVNL